MGLTASRVSLNHRHERICEKMTVWGWGGHRGVWNSTRGQACPRMLGATAPNQEKPGHEMDKDVAVGLIVWTSDSQPRIILPPRGP